LIQHPFLDAVQVKNGAKTHLIHQLIILRAVTDAEFIMVDFYREQGAETGA